MPGSLSRLARVRALQEELARRDLEIEVARLRGLEQGSRRAEEDARRSRERWFAAVCAGQAAKEVENRGADEGREEDGCEENGDARLRGGGLDAIAAESENATRRGEEAEWGRATERRRQTDALRPAQSERMAHAREAFQTVRRERLQVDALANAAAALERVRGERREQGQLDDWFQGRRRRAEQAGGMDRVCDEQEMEQAEKIGSTE